jgi:hypothetical protein
MQLVRELVLEDPARPQGLVLRTKADCLRICVEGADPADLARWNYLRRRHGGADQADP